MTFVSRPKNRKLSPQQEAILELVSDDWRPLSANEIGRKTGYSKPHSAWRGLNTLVKRGLIEVRSFHWQQHRANQYRRYDPNRKTKKPHPLAIGVYDE